jgi:dGTPase
MGDAKSRMEWTRLLSTARVSSFDVCKTTQPKASQYIDPRSPFERDYDQLVFSYPFRRLQDKTQVIPFPEFDFVHTRLTHSLEVASIGRSLGKLAASRIFKELPDSFIQDNKLCIGDIGALVAAACLAHDIGNPPFGHSGEDSISHYFGNKSNVFGGYTSEHYGFQEDEPLLDGDYPFSLDYNRANRTYIPAKTFHDHSKKWNDLIKFEGNANGFRILTRNCDKGINPTAALIGTFTKYPRESHLAHDPFASLSKKDKPKSQQKYGFFQDQRDLFKQVAENLGLLKVADISEFDLAFYRHPLAFLMEAADDIAYRIIDFEDGCRLELIDWQKPYRINDLLKLSPYQIMVSIAKLDESFDEARINEDTDFKEAISYIRAKAVNVLVHSVFDIWDANYEAIMTGKFDTALLDSVKNPTITENLNWMEYLVREKVYKYKPVLESEASGFEVMSALIESFAISTSVCFSCGEQETAKQKKLVSLLPQEYRLKDEREPGDLTFEEKYERVLRILDYVSGMTDNYAINLYRKIKGISLYR